MHYNFLEKAREQPDLQDFCGYLIEPLNKVNYILNKLNNDKNNSSEFLAVSHKIYSILNKDLPEVVDNFCNFSFEFRNTEKLQFKSQFLTPKDLLLLNTAKIIEEINILYKQSQQENIQKTLIMSNFLDKKGSQPKLSLTPDKLIEHEKLILKNNFNYSDFIEKNKSIVSSSLDNNNLNLSPKNKKDQEVNLLSTFFELFISLSFIGLTIYGLSSIAKIEQEKQIYNYELSNFSSINDSIKYIYVSTSEYINLNNNLLIQARLISPSSHIGSNIISSFGNINIESQNNSLYSSYSMTYSEVPQKHCTDFIFDNISGDKNSTIYSVEVNDKKVFDSDEKHGIYNQHNKYNNVLISNTCSLNEKSTVSFYMGKKLKSKDKKLATTNIPAIDVVPYTALNGKITK